MSKLIDNEASRKASFGILEALKEAENVEVKKTVMYEGACASCKSCKEPEGSNDPVPGEKKEPLKEDTNYLATFTIDYADDYVKELDIEKEVPNYITRVVYDALGPVKNDVIVGVNAKGPSGWPEVILKCTSEEAVEAVAKFLVDKGYGEDIEEVKDMYMMTESTALTEAETKTEEQEEIVSDDDTTVVEAEEKMVEGLEVLKSANGAFLLKESAGYIVGKNYDEKTGIIEEAECYKTEKVARRIFNKISK